MRYAKFKAKDDEPVKGSAPTPGIAAESPRKGMLPGKSKGKKKRK